MHVAATRLGVPVEVVADVLLTRDVRARYLVLDVLASTSRARVFVAVDLLLAHEVALKVSVEADEERVTQTLAEARMMAQIDHANVVRVFDVGEHGGHGYVAMELCEASLDAWSHGQPWRAVLERILDAAVGLEALHEAGLVHADVKPPNILVQGRQTKVADLGLAGPPGRVFRISGTAGFIAPEAVEGLRSEAGDVFGLAASAWHCLFGRPPFGEAPEHASVSAAAFILAERARQGELVRPKLCKGVPRSVVEILEHGLASDPAARPSLTRWCAMLRRASRERRSVWERLRGGARMEVSS